MTAELTLPKPGLEPGDRLADAARGAWKVATWSLTLAGATLFGTSLSVVMGVVTVVVAALTVLCVLAFGVVIAALLLVLAAACVVGAAVALAVGTLALVGTAGLKLSSLGARGLLRATERLGRMRGRRRGLPQVTSSSS